MKTKHTLPDRLRAATRSDYWLVAMLVLLALCLGLWQSGAKSAWWDESLSLMRATGTLADLFANRIRFAGAVTTDQHPPLYFAILYGVVRLAGTSDVALRFPSALFAAACIPLLYWLGRRLSGSRLGLLAALLGALAPFALWYAQEMRMYTLCMFLGLLSLVLLLRTLAQPCWYLLLGYTLVLTAGLLSQYMFALFVPVHALVAAASLTARRSAPRLPLHRRLLVLLSLVLPILAGGYVVAMTLQRIPELSSNRVYVPYWMMLHDVFNSFALGPSVVYKEIWGLDVAFWAVAALGLAAAAGLGYKGAPQMEHRCPRWMTAVTLLAYIFIPLTGIWLFSLITPLYMGSRYLLMSLPAFTMALAWGVDWLWRRVPLVAILALAVLLCGSLYSINRYFQHPLYSNKEDYRSAARQVTLQETAGDVIVVTGAESVAAFQHYYEGQLPIVPMPVIHTGWEVTEAQLESLGRDYTRIWFVEGNREISDPDGRMRNLITTRYTMQSEAVFNGYVYPILLSSYRAEPLYLEAAATGDADLGRFGSGLELNGLELGWLAADGQPMRAAAHELPAQVPAGKVVSVRLRVSILEQLPNYRTSLRLVDASSNLVAQEDAAPLYFIPSSQWPVGKQMLFSAQLRIPPGTPPGAYRLALVVYDEASGVATPYTPANASEELQALEGIALQVMEGQPTSFEAALYPPADAWRAHISFGAAELLGASMPTQVQRGTRLPITLYWRARGASASGLEAALAWRDASGRLSTPVNLGAISPSWPAGAWRTQRVLLEVPADLASGRVTPVLMVRDPVSGEFLTTSWGFLPRFRRSVALPPLEITE